MEENKWFYAYMRLKGKWEAKEKPPIDSWGDPEVFDWLLDVMTKVKAWKGSDRFESTKNYVETVLDNIEAIKSVWNDEDSTLTMNLALIEACYTCMLQNMREIEKGR